MCPDRASATLTHEVPSDMRADHELLREPFGRCAEPDTNRARTLWDSEATGLPRASIGSALPVSIPVRLTRRRWSTSVLVRRVHSSRVPPALAHRWDRLTATEQDGR